MILLSDGVRSRYGRIFVTWIITAIGVAGLYMCRKYALFVSVNGV